MNQKILFAIGIVCLFSINLVLAAPWIESGVGMCAGSDCDNNSSSSPSYLVNLAVEDEEGNPQMANITTYKTNAGNLINSYSVYGNVSFPLNDQKIDMDISYDESNLYMKLQNLSVSDINATNSRIIMNDAVVGDFVNASNIHVLRAYKVELPSNFHTSKIILKIAYSDLTVVNESSLVLYRCGNYDLNSDTCVSGWEPVTISIDTVQKLVTANINSFSIYGLGENENNSTTTSTTTTTSSTTTTSATTSTTSTSQPQSSGGSSSGGSSGGSYVPSTSSTTTTRSTTTTSKPTTTTTSSTTTTTKQTMSTTMSQYFTGMSTFLKSNSYAIVISIVVAAGMVVGWMFFKNKPVASYKSSYSKPARYQGKSKKKYSYDETRLVMN